MKRIFSVILLALLAGSCVTLDQQFEEKLAAVPRSEWAYMLGKFSVSCKPYKDRFCTQRFNVLSVFFRSTTDSTIVNSIESEHGALGREDTVYDYVSFDKEEKSFYFCRPIPPGSYEFYSYSFYNFAGGGSGYYIDKEDHFSIPFEASPGSALYIGHLKLTTSTGRNIFGVKLPTPGILLVSKAEDEMALALAKCPEEVQTRGIVLSGFTASMAGDSPLVEDI